MAKNLLTVLFCFFLIYSGCSSEDNTVTPTPDPGTGPVLLATVAGDSLGRNTGSSTRYISISGQTLNFTDRDSARISFYYSGENNTSPIAFQIYYDVNDSTSSVIYNSTDLTITPTEQFADIILPSPKVNSFFHYRMQVISPGGFAFFKFRDLKIYKQN